MKKLSAVIFALMLMITMTSCKGGSVSHDNYKRIYDMYSNIDSFAAEAEITVKSNLTENTYTVKQYYLAPDNYKMEITAPESLSGTGYSYCDGRINMKSGYGEIFSLEDYVPEDRNYVFINDFFEGYYKSEDAFVETGKTSLNDECTVLKNVLSDGNPYRYSQCMWISNDGFEPKKLVTYDMDNNEVLTVTYKSFTINKEIKKELFKE